MICAEPTLAIENMSGVKNLSDEKNIHLAFEISLLLKGVFALGEIIGGVVALFVTKELLLKIVGVLTQEELAEDPRDLIANYLLHSTQNFSISTQYFVALYLLSPRQRQVMADYRASARETLVLSYRHYRLRLVHRLSAVQVQLHAFSVAAIDNSSGCYRHRPHVA
jgi:Predicted membrane protein (DUF2127)